MQTLVMLLIVALAGACSGSTSEAARADASLELQIGSDVAKALDVEPLYATSDTRLVITVQQNGLTALVSLAIPISSGTRHASNAAELVIWAKVGSEQPMIATSGHIDVSRTNNVVELVLVDVTKADDTFGGSFKLKGQVRGLTLQ